MFSDYTGFKTVRTNVHAIQRNYLDVTKLKYYIPNEVETQGLDGLRASPEGLKKLASGEVDPVQLLFSEAGVEQAVQTSKDPFMISVENWPK